MSKQKQPATLPGMAEATPTPHPVPTEESPAAEMRASDLGMCVVCGYDIGPKQSFVQSIMTGRYEHADCQVAAHADHESATSEPAEHHPLAGALSATFGRDEPAPAAPKKKKRTERTPSQTVTYTEKKWAKFTLAQRRAMYAMLSVVCEPMLGEQP